MADGWPSSPQAMFTKSAWLAVRQCTLADTQYHLGLGLTWFDRDVYYSGDAGIMRVSADGGRPSLVVKPDAGRGEWMLSYPDVLPNGPRRASLPRRPTRCRRTTTRVSWLSDSIPANVEP